MTRTGGEEDGRSRVMPVMDWRALKYLRGFGEMVDGSHGSRRTEKT
jgi:hypothetical protein